MLIGWVGSTIAVGLLLALGSRFAMLQCFWVFSGRAEAETGTGARVPTFELVPGLLVENLDTVAARMGMGLFVDCMRVSWS